ERSPALRTSMGSTRNSRRLCSATERRLLKLDPTVRSRDKKPMHQHCRHSTLPRQRWWQLRGTVMRFEEVAPRRAKSLILTGSLSPTSLCLLAPVFWSETLELEDPSLCG